VQNGRSQRLPLILIGVIIMIGAVGYLVAAPLMDRWAGADRSCENLMPRSEVEAALAAHPDVAAKLEAVSPGVRVEVVEPCAEKPGMATIRVSYGQKVDLEYLRNTLMGSRFGDAPTVLRSR
jgi:hypothetical protein